MTMSATAAMSGSMSATRNLVPDRLRLAEEPNSGCAASRLDADHSGSMDLAELKSALKTLQEASRAAGGVRAQIQAQAGERHERLLRT